MKIDSLRKLAETALEHSYGDPKREEILASAILKLLPFVVHHSRCLSESSIPGGDRSCSCGLDAALADIKEPR